MPPRVHLVLWVVIIEYICTGSYSSTGASTCLPCTAGNYCEDPAVSPQSCGSGYYSLGGFNVSK